MRVSSTGRIVGDVGVRSVDDVRVVAVSVTECGRGESSNSFHLRPSRGMGNHPFILSTPNAISPLQPTSSLRFPFLLHPGLQPSHPFHCFLLTRIGPTTSPTPTSSPKTSPFCSTSTSPVHRMSKTTVLTAGIASRHSPIPNCSSSGAERARATSEGHIVLGYSRSERRDLM